MNHNEKNKAELYKKTSEIYDIIKKLEKKLYDLEETIEKIFPDQEV